MTAATVLAAHDLHFAYHRDTVLHGVTINLLPREILGLVGPNGAGKSTLLKLLTGYLRPRSGEAVLRGQPVGNYSRPRIAREIAFVPQRTDQEFPFRVIEAVLMGRHAYAGFSALDSADDIDIAIKALDQFGLAALANRPVAELSGGEQQLVVLARALAQSAPVFILDEPVTFLDLKRQWTVLTVLEKLRDSGSAILATFHDLNLAARFCDRIGLLSGGRLIACDRPAVVLTEPVLSAAYDFPLRVESRAGGVPHVEFAR